MTPEISATNNPFNKTESYTLKLSTGKVDRTHWWKDCNSTEPANIWWVSGGGESRLATPVEIQLWLRLQQAESALAKKT